MSLLWLVRMIPFLPLCKLSELYNIFFLAILFCLVEFHPTQIIAQPDSRTSLWNSPEPFLCHCLLSHTLPHELQPPLSPQTLVFASSSQWNCRLCLGSPPVVLSRNHPPGSKPGQSYLHLAGWLPFSQGLECCAAWSPVLRQVTAHVWTTSSCVWQDCSSAVMAPQE